MERGHHMDILPHLSSLPPQFTSFPQTCVLCSIWAREAKLRSSGEGSLLNSAFRSWVLPYRKTVFSWAPGSGEEDDSPSLCNCFSVDFFFSPLGIILNLQKSCKNSTKNSHIPRFPKYYHLTEPLYNDQNEENDMDALFNLICRSYSNFPAISLTPIF